MPIYVKDDTADQLLEDVMRLSGKEKKVDVIVEALREKKDRLEKKVPFSERIAPLQAKMRALGPSDPSFDMKAFSDEMSGE